MKIATLLIFCLLYQQHGTVKVQVEEGWLEGEQLPLVTGDGDYYSFKGIPYATPPIGNLRFKAPTPYQPWEGVRNATEHGSICIQYDVYNNRVVPGSEDCLFLNVYTPDLKPKKFLPVMVYIHGGGYESDSGNVDNYGPDFLVQNEVVLVTFNYRLEVLGFLSLETEEVPGNAGMKDQVAALKWVKKNIDKFGGDPDNITVFGQSAGGASVIFHMTSPMSKGLFKRAVSMSGVPSCDWSIAYQPRRRAITLAKRLGLNSNDPQKIYEFLKDLPAEKLINKSPSVLASEEITGNIIKMFHFVPVVEKDFGQEHFLTEDPEIAIKEGKANDVDLIIGHTSEENIYDLIHNKNLFLKTYSIYEELLVPRKILYRNNPDKLLPIGDEIQRHYFGTKPIDENSLRELLTYLNDSTYFYDIYRYIQLLSKYLHSKLFVYKFSAISNRNIYGEVGAKYNLIGASHLDDIAHIFDPKQANLTVNKSSKEYKIVKQTTTLFTNFASYGNPTPDSNLGEIWQEYDNVTQKYMDIGDTLTLGRSLDSEAAEFWKSIFEMAGMEF